jgi:hypothetical protein
MPPGSTSVNVEARPVTDGLSMNFNISIEIQALWAWSEFNGYAS